MDVLAGIFSWISGLSSIVFIPIIICIMGVCFGVKPGTAVRSALMMGGGILAITTISSMMIEYITPMGNALIENAGIHNDVLDVGVAPVFGAVMQLPFFVFLYPIGLLVNAIMIKFRWTKTVNVDFLNLFAIILPALPIYLLTGNVIVTLVVSVIVYVFSLKVADLTAPLYQKYYGLEGVSLTHPFDVFSMVVGLGINWIIEHVPGLNKVNVRIADIHEKIGLLGDPAFLSFAVGTILGLIAQMGFNASVSIGMALACVTYIFPRAVGVIMEGLSPVSEKMREGMFKLFKIENANVGMDTAILAGYPEAVATGAFAIPIVLALYFILPGVRMIPSGEALMLAATMGVLLPLAGPKDKKGNAFRALIMLVVITTIKFYGAMIMAPLATDLAVATGMVAEGATVTSSIMGAWPTIIVYYITNLFV